MTEATTTLTRAGTVRTLAVALKHPQHWRFIQALPAAVWCLREGVELLHAHFADENLVVASIISSWTGIPYSVTTHRYDILGDPIDKATAIRLFRGAAAVITISEFNRRHMERKYGLPISKVHVVHCGIDLDRFVFSERQLPSNGQALRILNIGRLAPEKAQDILLTAMSLVRARKIPFILEIIGGGPEQNKLMQMANKLNLADAVIFHGVQTEAYVRARLAEADLFVLSSRSEGLPVVLMEALAIGAPVIATHIFGIPELIENGISGLLVPPDDPQALADAVCLAHTDPVSFRNMPAAGRRTVEALFERGACTNQLIRLWDDALKVSENET